MAREIVIDGTSSGSGIGPSHPAICALALRSPSSGTPPNCLPMTSALWSMGDIASVKAHGSCPMHCTSKRSPSSLAMHVVTPSVSGATLR